MLCCRFLSRTPLSAPSIITINNGKLFSDKRHRHHQIARSSPSPTPATNYSTKSDVSMDSTQKTQEPPFEFLTFSDANSQWNLPNLPKNTEVYLKRDDLSGMQLSGNKVRKLEFLLADAVAQGADCIITIGGIQSNHCCATAVLVDKDPGLTGNLLVERLVGAHIDLVSKEEYANVGSVALTSILKEKLLSEGESRMSFQWVDPIPWVPRNIMHMGYIEAVREIQQQLQKTNGEVLFDDIVVACGSGGTIAGLSVGTWLSDLGAKVHAYCVCDDPDYFYDYAQGLLDGLQANVTSRDIVNIQNAKGLGYAINTAEEIKFVREIAEATSVVLDPVYSGKAAYGMMRDMAANPGKWEGKKVLFVHTGGLLGLFEKTDALANIVLEASEFE